MTKKKWLECTDPDWMLEFLRDKASPRKLRLFGCACCRRSWHLLFDSGSRKAVEVAEDFAEGKADEKKLGKAWERADSVSSAMDEGTHRRAAEDTAWAAAAVAELVDGQDMSVDGAKDVARSTAIASAQNPEDHKPDPQERRKQCALLRDLFDSLFARTKRPSVWLSSEVTRLADSIYTDRAFDRLPLLADALEEAGCNDAAILDHCRQPGEHVRGCWVVDLILGKE